MEGAEPDRLPGNQPCSYLKRFNSLPTSTRGMLSAPQHLEVRRVHIPRCSRVSPSSSPVCSLFPHQIGDTPMQLGPSGACTYSTFPVPSHESFNVFPGSLGYHWSALAHLSQQHSSGIVTQSTHPPQPRILLPHLIFELGNSQTLRLDVLQSLTYGAHLLANYAFSQRAAMSEETSACSPAGL